MFADLLLSLLFIAGACTAALAVVTLEYLPNRRAHAANLMKHGVFFQIACLVVLGLLRLQWRELDMLLNFIPVLALAGAGMFMLGALNVAKLMTQARTAFTLLSIVLQLCIVAFFTITSCLIP